MQLERGKQSLQKDLDAKDQEMEEVRTGAQNKVSYGWNGTDMGEGNGQGLMTGLCSQLLMKDVPDTLWVKIEHVWLVRER